MEASLSKGTVLSRKKSKRHQFDLKLPEFIRVDWRRPKCLCQAGMCLCSSFTCRMTYTSSKPPEDKNVHTKEEEGIEWSNLVNIDLLNLSTRRANANDFESIRNLVDNSCKSTFDIDDEGSKILHLIEHSFCFLVAVNFQGIIVGAISVNDTPPLCYIAEEDWDTWLHSKYGLYKFRSHNTLWIDFMAYMKRYKHVVFQFLLCPVFRMYFMITKIAIYLPPHKKFKKSWACNFSRVGTPFKPNLDESRWETESEAEEYPTNIYCVGRHQFLYHFGLREVKKEDKEVIRKTLESEHKLLSKMYGANYLDTIIGDQRLHTFMGSYEGLSSTEELPAVFVTKTDFDLEDIKEKFEIFAFNNFKRNRATDFLMQPEKRYISAVSQEIVELSDVLNGDDLKRPYHEADDKDDVEEKEEKDEEEGEPTVIGIEGLTWTNFLMTGTQDSDEEEGRGMDRIISTDNPIDKITYKNLCMTMSSSNLTKDLKSFLTRKTQTTTTNLSFEVEGNCNAIYLEHINMGSIPIENVRTLFLLILNQLQTFEYILLKIPRKLQPPPCVTYMMRVPPKGHKSWFYYEEELYVCHRWFLSGNAECRKAVRADFQTLLNVLCMENSSDEIQEELFISLFGEEHRNTAVVFCVNKKIVGSAIVGPEREMEFYQFHYDLASVMSDSLHNQSEVGYVKHMVINGLHEFRTREFVRKFMQFMGWKSVFFSRFPAYIHEQIKDFSIPLGLRHFVPIRPRRVPQYVPSLRGRVPPYHLRNDYPPFALYYLNYRISSFPKNINHTKIVVVGTGETGLSFLENLIFRTSSVYELFAEIVVITKHRAAFAYPHKVKMATRRKKSGNIPMAKSEDLHLTWLNIMKERLDASRYPELRSPQYKLENFLRMYSADNKSQKDETVTETTLKKIAKIMIPQDGQYSPKYLCKLGLETWTTVVEGTMTGIHRDEKCVEVDGKKVIPYDYLFLFCGRQFSTPQADHRNIVLGKECKALYDLRAPWIERASLKPRNLFTINCLYDASVALQYIKRLNPGKGQILIYGSCVNCLSCIEALLKFGVTPSRIAFVESDLRAPYAIDYFNDPVVYKAVRRKLFEIGISHYFYYNFVNWDYNDVSQLITKAHFESESKMASLKCIALFSFAPKAVGLETMLAYMDSNLVYDGGLVIDADFRTNDPYIYAAGPGTRYKKKYFADHYFHEHYNSSEVGEEMAERINLIIPGLPDKDMAAMQDIIDFKKPIVTRCNMPGDKHLLMVRRPGPIVPLEVLINQLDFGSIIVTGNANNPENSVEPEYFKIILNDQNYVIDILCLSSIPIDADNLIQLYGKHERALNNLLLRYRSHVITDLYEYFKEPWAYIFYHDRFDNLMEEMRSLFYAKVSASDVPILEELFRNYPQLHMKIAKMIEQFYNDNRNHLPMSVNDEFIRSMNQIVSDNIIYLPTHQRAGGKPLVSKPYTFEKHKQMYRPQEFYEKIE